MVKRNRGEDSAFAKLTEAQVRALRAKTKVYNLKTHKQDVRFADNRFPDIIARAYGIDIRTLRRIRNFKSWQHVL